MSLTPVYDHDELGHATIVTYSRRWFRKVYWVRCVNCNLRVGPFLNREDADRYSKLLWGTNATKDA